MLEIDVCGNTLIAWFDSCVDPNKNFCMMAFWHFLVQKERFKKVYHVFLVVGRSYMDFDRDFGLNEN